MDGPAADAAADPQHPPDVQVLTVLGTVAERSRLDQRVLVDEAAVPEAELIVAEVLTLQPRTLLEHAHPRPRLGEHIRGDAPAGPGADDDDIEWLDAHQGNGLTVLVLYENESTQPP